MHGAGDANKWDLRGGTLGVFRGEGHGSGRQRQARHKSHSRLTGMHMGGAHHPAVKEKSSHIPPPTHQAYILTCMGFNGHYSVTYLAMAGAPTRTDVASLFPAVLARRENMMIAVNWPWKGGLGPTTDIRERHQGLCK